MSTTAVLFGMLIATLYGSLFHLWRGGSLARLLVFIVMSWIGFWSGQLLAERMGWLFWSIGSIHIGFASVGSVIFLAIATWLGLESKASDEK